MSYNASPWTRLVAQLQWPPLDQLPAEQCQFCRESLPAFVSDELAGVVVDDWYTDTAVHLDICPACFQEYEELLDLALAALYDVEDAV